MAHGILRRCWVLSFLSIAQAAGEYYRELGVRRSASSTDIKAAYRDAAKKYHPDKNKDPNAQDRFRRIAAAYETLSDPEKRRLYDLHGSDYEKVSQQQQQADQARRQQEEFFNAFGGGHQGRRRNSGPPIFSSTVWVNSEAYRDLIEDSTDSWLLQFYHGELTNQPCTLHCRTRTVHALTHAACSPACRKSSRAQTGASRARSLRRGGRPSPASCRRWSGLVASTLTRTLVSCSATALSCAAGRMPSSWSAPRRRLCSSRPAPMAGCRRRLSAGGIRHRRSKSTSG